MSRYTFHVADDSPMRHDVGRLTAYDKDSSPHNQFAFYIIPDPTGGASSRFGVEPKTGVLFTQRSLRGHVERGVYNLTAVVQSESLPHVTDLTTVSVHVMDSEVWM